MGLLSSRAKARQRDRSFFSMQAGLMQAEEQAPHTYIDIAFFHQHFVLSGLK